MFECHFPFHRQGLEQKGHYKWLFDANKNSSSNANNNINNNNAHNNVNNNDNPGSAASQEGKFEYDPFDESLGLSSQLILEKPRSNYSYGAAGGNQVYGPQLPDAMQCKYE